LGGRKELTFALAFVLGSLLPPKINLLLATMVLLQRCLYYRHPFLSISLTHLTVFDIVQRNTLAVAIADGDDFNSSDLEFKALPAEGDRYRRKSIKNMLKSTFEDRVESKRALKLLTDDIGAPMSRIHKALIFNRFNIFYTTTLKKRHVATCILYLIQGSMLTTN
jgi:hypothetical protein